MTTQFIRYAPSHFSTHTLYKNGSKKVVTFYRHHRTIVLLLLRLNSKQVQMQEAVVCMRADRTEMTHIAYMQSHLHVVGVFIYLFFYYTIKLANLSFRELHRLFQRGTYTRIYIIQYGGSAYMHM